MYFIADFHIHSKYSRATSREMDIEHISRWARLKGVNLMGTGDFTHPEWRRELRAHLDNEEYGVYSHNDILYMLTAEVNNIYFKMGKTRKIHNIIFSPSLEVADRISDMLSQFGNIYSDGRPILSIGCEEMVIRLKDINEDIFVVPAHVWTPHFAIFGANSGFDSIEDCYGSFSDSIYALETGLSSDPPMNWRLSKLDRFCLVSNSDAHSPSKIGREANVFSKRFGYKELIDILKTKDKTRLLFTIEFFPEEGKYHWDGHRKCGLRLSPKEAKDLKYKCPKCGGKITVGVMHRIESLCDRKEGFVLEDAPSYKSLVPLIEIIADAMDMGTESLTVKREYNSLISTFGNEFNILLDVPEDRLIEDVAPRIARGIINARNGDVSVLPGYDGEYGEVNVFSNKDGKAEQKQLELF